MLLPPSSGGNKEFVVAYGLTSGCELWTHGDPADFREAMGGDGPRATPERHEEPARFPAMDDKTWNVPTIGGGVLLVRNTREMAAFRIGV